MRKPLSLALVSLCIAMSPAVAAAQTSDPTLLVLEPVGAPDAALSRQIVTSVTEVGRTLGYHVVTAAPGSSVGALDPTAGTDLVGVATRTGVHRAVAVWIGSAISGYDVQVGIASGDGSAMSLRAAASASSIVETATRLFASILPPPFAASSGAWGGAAVVGAAPTAAPVMAPTYATTSAPVPAEPERVSHRRETGLMIGGGITLAASWVFGFVIGLFGGYHDRVCWIGPCSSGGTSWDPAWDSFRASSLVPIIGPWIQLAVKPSSDDGWPEWLVVDEIIQGAGAILLFVGAGLFASGSDDPPPVAFVPMVGPGLVGVMSAGQF